LNDLEVEEEEEGTDFVGDEDVDIGLRYDLSSELSPLFGKI
jgi:hypothetical protein